MKIGLELKSTDCAKQFKMLHPILLCFNPLFYPIHLEAKDDGDDSKSSRLEKKLESIRENKKELLECSHTS